MTWTKLKLATAAALISATWGGTGGLGAEPADEEGAIRIAREDLATLHRMIRPDLEAGEWVWNQIPWVTNLTEGRKKAAREGKPMLLWCTTTHGLLGL